MPRKATGNWTLTVTATGPLPKSVLDLNGGTLNISQQLIGPSKGDSFNILVAKVSAKGSSASQAVSAAIDGDNKIGFVFMTSETPSQPYILAHGKVNSGLNQINEGIIYSQTSDFETDPIEEGTWSATSGGPGEGGGDKY